MVGLLAVACGSLSLVLATPGALATSGGGGNLEQVEAKLNSCRTDLAQARQAAREADAFLALVRKKRLLIFNIAQGQFVPVQVDDYRDMLILQFVTGKISRAELTQSLTRMAQRFAASLRVLAELRDEARDDVEKTAKRCAALAAERDRLRAGGGGGGGGGTGAFPGGTATKLTITLQGSTVTLDLKTGVRTGVRNIPGTHRGTVSGSVGTDGTLPAGWNIYVVGESRIVRTGEGPFTIRDSIGSGSQRGADAIAQICSSPPPANQPFCLTGNRRADVSVGFFWAP